MFKRRMLKRCLTRGGEAQDVEAEDVEAVFDPGGSRGTSDMKGGV
jgi:hypothetical protein